MWLIIEYRSWVLSKRLPIIITGPAYFVLMMRFCDQADARFQMEGIFFLCTFASLCEAMILLVVYWN
jgi:hypothetical protein